MPCHRCLGCGESLPAFVKPRAGSRRKPRAITFGNARVPMAGEWYREAMRVQAGELVWDPNANADRFGVRGGYVAAEREPVLVAREATE